MNKYTKFLWIASIIVLIVIAAAFVGWIIFFQKPDLVIENVYKTPYEFTVTIKNIGHAEITSPVYLCVWDKGYREKSGSNCDQQMVTNLNTSDNAKSTFDVLPIKAGESYNFTFTGSSYFPPLYLAVDVGNDANTNNLVKESNENNNIFIYNK